jgi:diguanylate cyclase (GGDEF)-like protein
VARLREELVRLRRLLAVERDAAGRDVLTGLLNRRGLYHRAERMLAGPDGLPVTVLMLDLDGFKPVNDTYGHRAGDQVLVTVATRLATHLGDGWCCTRLGGDELAALRVGPLHHPPAALAEGLSSVLTAPIRAGGRDLRVGAAIGVATATTPVMVGELLARADQAMYHAKCEGRPVLWQPSHEESGTGVRPLLRTRNMPVPATAGFERAGVR